MDTQSDAGPLIQVRSLKKYFPLKKGVFSRSLTHVRAVDEVSFTIGEGETLGLVGESGCGKTTVGKAILRLVEPSGGIVLFQAKDVLALNRDQLRRLRREMQMVFQDPFNSLNPRLRLDAILAEGLDIHNLYGGPSRRARVDELLSMVGLSPHDACKYPHEFSSGQRQRIGIARALSVHPKFIVADEPVSALDVSIQAQILNLFIDIQKEFDLTYLFITHDLGVVRYVCHRVAVMYLGRIVELAGTSSLFRSPLHPYSRTLLSAVPHIDPRMKRDRIPSQGEVPDIVNPPAGCPFHPRCLLHSRECQEVVPELRDVGEGHLVRCLKVC